MLSSSGRKTFRALVLSLTQAVLVPTGAVVAVVELLPDDVDGDCVQEANVMAVRAMVNHNKTGFRRRIRESFAARRSIRRIVAPGSGNPSQRLAERARLSQNTGWVGHR